MATGVNSADLSSPAGSSGSNVAPNASNPSLSSITVQNITGMVATKLTRHNYITWRSLFLPVLKRFKLLGLVNGTDVCPPPFVTDSSGSQVSNPAFENWCDRDQILMIWINSTLSEDLLPLTVGMDDSRSLWQSLERRFSGASHTHIHSLRSKIQTIQKGDSSMTDYLNSLKEISDKLAAAGEPISDSDLVAYILSGLSTEYESFIDYIETRSDFVNPDELHGLLLSKEISLLKRKSREPSSSSAPFHAYTAQPGSNNFRGRGRFQNKNRYNSNRNFGGNRHYNNTSGGLLGPGPNSRSTFSGQNFTNSFSGRSLQCQLCLKFGHEALNCEKLLQFASQRSPHGPPVGMTAATSPPPSYWLTDSGASHHVTPDPSSLNSAIPYNGSDQLFVGNGKGLYISHTGSALIRTSNATFKLNDVLLVPKASHNLLSVYKFVYDNWASLTFDPFGFYIKDLRTGKMLFQGLCEGGLYPFYWTASNKTSGIALSPTALMIAKADVHLWHKRLGHPSSLVLHNVVHKH
ncbi:hypothetical protein ACFX2C_043433 [Malus domestica]